MMVNCIAIDDEPLALSLVCSFIEQTPFLRLKGRYGNAAAALARLDVMDVQLVFLDIQMPDVSGMQLARILGNGRGPRIVFTTAYNHYAIEGYKVDALDYLLKPFNYEEFLRAASKARAYQAASPEQGYLFLKVEHQLVQVAHEDVLYVEACRDYVKVHIRGESKPVMSLTTLKSVEEKLPAGQFMRVHKSFIVSLGKINSISKSAVHIAGAVIAIGDQYKEGLKQFIEKWTL
ncbi:LytR/AlgR family response regulator transcription factor [Dinghuibacter silviterrae]|uniref:LytTR family two component transcriptional regulator n=1 Tax=Dinghuibacter silviterrae TaxID=1539049 RepID=A0A4R8DHJ1_9BACT|nr:LytTR family DNA-binding domain-containing protein [Dinghuibacter silviterrae]TDW97189.1 LytTR family two component transcriptional regulator [Dinghuibacter silviterrae]